MLCTNRRFKVCFFIICIIFCGTAIHFLMLFHNYCCTLLDYTFSSQYSGFLYYLHKYYLFCWGTYFEFYLLISLTYVSSCSICSCSSNIYVIYKYICITAVTVTWRDFSIVVLNLIWLLVMYVPRAFQPVICVEFRLLVIFLVHQIYDFLILSSFCINL